MQAVRVVFINWTVVLVVGQSPSWFSWAGSCDTAKARSVSGCGVSGLHLCFFADDALLSASVVDDLQLHWKSLPSVVVIRTNLTL